MEYIKHICINLNNDEIIACTTTTALAKFMKRSTRYLEKKHINSIDVFKDRTFIVYNQVKISKLIRGRNNF